MAGVPLYKVLKKSYNNLDEADLGEYGYILDRKLSNYQNKVYYNPHTKQLLFSVAGTDPTNLEDLYTDVKLAFGGHHKYFGGLVGGLLGGSTGVPAGVALSSQLLGNGGFKETDRYLNAHKALKKAKEKYPYNEAIVAGSSLGGAIASHIASKSDKVYTYNKASTFGGKTRANEKAYRIKGDYVSGINPSKGATELKPYLPEKKGNLRANHKVEYVKEPLINHSIEHLKHQSPIIGEKQRRVITYEENMKLPKNKQIYIPQGSEVY